MDARFALQYLDTEFTDPAGLYIWAKFVPSALEFSHCLGTPPSFDPDPSHSAEKVHIPSQIPGSRPGPRRVKWVFKLADLGYKPGPDTLADDAQDGCG